MKYSIEWEPDDGVPSPPISECLLLMCKADKNVRPTIRYFLFACNDIH